jgi:uncharacterized protein (TIGR04255 family)
VERYRNAPITEAILDIQVKPSAPPPTQAVFTRLSGALGGEYPRVADINQLRVNVHAASTTSSVAHTRQTAGSRLEKPGRVFQIQPRGMTFSHLTPYTSWSVFSPEGRRLWELYVQYVKPEAVTRVALRYINRIEIPGQRFELSDYFKLYPEIPKTIPQDINSTFIQLQMPQIDLAPDIVAVFNFGSAVPFSDKSVAMMLDIDVYATRALSLATKDVFDVLEILRTRKNELFEACITDRTRDIFR